MKSRYIFFAGLFISLFIFLLFMIPGWVSEFRESQYKQINLNGVLIDGEVYAKSTHKGKWVKFRYIYKGKLFRNEMQNDTLYTLTSSGDSVTIVADSLNPGKSYVKRFW